MLLDAPLWENRILGHQTAAAGRARARSSTARRARADTERIMREYDVRAPGPDTLAVALSGGNQQKLIVGREMSAEPAAADRRPPDPRGRRRRAGGDLGAAQGRPRRRDGRSC